MRNISVLACLLTVYLIANTPLAQAQVPEHVQSREASPESWQRLMDKAETETNLTKKKELLDIALTHATLPEHSFETYLKISDVRTEQGIDGEAIFYAGKAIEIVDEKMPNDAPRRTKAVVQKSEALKRVGRLDEAIQVITDDVARKSQQGDHIWRPVDGGIMHRFTGMVCPDFLEGMPREDFQNYSQAGIDAGCSYKLISEHANYVTVYITRYGGELDDIDAITGGGAALLRNNPNADRKIIKQPATFTSGEGRPVYYTQVRYGSPQSGERYTGAWTQVIDGWVLKTRVTWDTKLGVDFGTEKTKAIFNYNSDNILEHFNNCEALDAPKTGQPVKTEDLGTTIMMNTLLRGAMEEVVKNVEDGDNKPGETHSFETPPIAAPKMPVKACYAGKTSGDELSLGYHPDSTRRYSVFSAVIDADFFVAKADPPTAMLSDNPDQFFLKSVEDGTESIYEVYDDEPAPGLVIQSIVDAVNGNKPALSSISKDDGNMNIYMDPAVLESDEGEE